jgi:RNA polymerase primary sigma factor
LVNAVQPVHVPVYMVELIARWKYALQRLELRLGRRPTLTELAEETGLPPRRLRIIRRAVCAGRAAPQASLDADGQPTSLAEMLRDDRAEAPDELSLRRDDLATVRRLLDSIGEREARILRMRFGLDGLMSRTLREIADELGLSRERVRQIADDALSKLGAHMAGSGLSVRVRDSRRDRAQIRDGGCESEGRPEAPEVVLAAAIDN